MVEPCSRDKFILMLFASNTKTPPVSMQICLTVTF